MITDPQISGRNQVEHEEQKAPVRPKFRKLSSDEVVEMINGKQVVVEEDKEDVPAPSNEDMLSPRSHRSSDVAAAASPQERAS